MGSIGEGRGRRGVSRFGPKKQSKTIIFSRKKPENQTMESSSPCPWSERRTWWEGEIFSKTKICQNMFSNQEPGASETSKPLRSRPPWGLPGWPEGRPDGQGGEESGSKIRSTWLAARSSCCATRRWSCCSRCAPRKELGNLDYRWACTVQVSTGLWKMVWKTLSYDLVAFLPPDVLPFSIQ